MNTAKKYAPDATEKLYFTSDSLAFFDEQNAINHTTHLKDKTVTTKTRAEVENEIAAITNDQWEDDLFWNLEPEAIS